MPDKITVTLQEVVQRALDATKRTVDYELGKGGYDPNAAYPDQKGECDCSGFLSWALGTSRERNDISYVWVETTRICNDAKGAHELFEQAKEAKAGYAIAYGDSGGSEGHCGVITAVANGKPSRVAHCTARGGLSTAIIDEPASVFWDGAVANRGAIYMRDVEVLEENVNIIKTKVIVDGVASEGVFDDDEDENYVKFADIKTALSDGVPRTWTWDDDADPMTLTIKKA